MNIKGKLNNLTGLQRVFLVAFLVCWGYYALFGAITRANEVAQSDMFFGWRISQELKNPNCLPYATKPISELTEPAVMGDGDTCWHLYVHRDVYKDSEVPFTQQSLDKYQSRNYWGAFFKTLGMNSAIVLTAFGLLMIAYKIGGWIFAGFNKNK